MTSEQFFLIHWLENIFKLQASVTLTFNSNNDSDDDDLKDIHVKILEKNLNKKFSKFNKENNSVKSMLELWVLVSVLRLWPQKPLWNFKCTS